MARLKYLIGTDMDGNNILPGVFDTRKSATQDAMARAAIRPRRLYVFEATVRLVDSVRA